MTWTQIIADSLILGTAGAVFAWIAIHLYRGTWFHDLPGRHGTIVDFHTSSSCMVLLLSVLTRSELMTHPIPLASKKNIAIAIRMMATYPGDIQAARRKIMERAREIGAEDLIPDNWNEDGTLK